MPTTVNGVVATGKGDPVTVVPIVVPDPGPGEVVVDVHACGVCHTDLHYREGAINDDFPFLLGHEAAGVVEAVGDGVTDVAPGDYVVLAWRAPCGDCRSCRRGRPWYCFDSANAAQPMTLADGTPLVAGLGIGAFAEKTLVAAGQAVKVDPAARPEAAGLIGCGVMAGFGAAVNTGSVSSGDTVAVSAAAASATRPSPAAVIAGARMVIAVDVDDRKLEWARRFGATHTVDARGTDPVEAIRGLTGGNGADVVIEAVGRPETYRQAFFARDLAGTLVQVGVPDPSMTIELPMIELFGRGGALKSSWYGDCLPTRDFPILIDLYLTRPARPRRLRLRDDRPRRRRGSLRPNAARRGPPVRGRHRDLNRTAAVSTSSTVVLLLAVFGASTVEMVEALTIVVAAGTTRGWRSALEGAAAAVVVLGALVGAVGVPLIHYVPLDALRVVVGALLLVLGLSWLRKAILRASGHKAKHDEDAIFAETTADLRRPHGTADLRRVPISPRPTGSASPWPSRASSWRGPRSSSSWSASAPASIVSDSPRLAAAAAAVMVAVVGLVVARQLAAVPENTIKTVVGIMLTSFGLFWVGEGAGVHWPGSDLAILVLIAVFAGVTAIAVAWMRTLLPDSTRPTRSAGRRPSRSATRQRPSASTEEPAAQ